MDNEVRIIVKWCGKEYEICNIRETDTVSTLKDLVHKETGVRPERQKLLNLRFKGYVLQYFFYSYTHQYTYDTHSPTRSQSRNMVLIVDLFDQLLLKLH